MDRPRWLPYAQRVDSRSQRERLREAMVRVAAAKGIAATTVEEVAEAAGVSSEAFHELYPDKEACLLDAFDGVIAVVVAHVSDAFEAAAGSPWPERVVAALRALVELLAAEADVARLTMIEVSATGDEARKRYGVALERFTPFLEEGREHSEQVDLPPDTARFAIGGAAALVFDELRAGRGPELPGILPDLVFAVLMPYLGPQAAEEEMRRVAA